MIILRRLQLLWAVFRHKKTPWVVRILLLFGFAYILLPFDLIPDHLLFVGWMDDLALAIVLVMAALKYTPEAVLRQLVHKDKKDSS